MNIFTTKGHKLLTALEAKELSRPMAERKPLFSTEVSETFFETTLQSIGVSASDGAEMTRIFWEPTLTDSEKGEVAKNLKRLGFTVQTPYADTLQVGW